MTTVRGGHPEPGGDLRGGQPFRDQPGDPYPPGPAASVPALPPLRRTRDVLAALLCPYADAVELREGGGPPPVHADTARIPSAVPPPPC